MVLCVQGHQNRMTGIRASQKENDLSRPLYRNAALVLNSEKAEEPEKRPSKLAKLLFQSVNPKSEGSTI